MSSANPLSLLIATGNPGKVVEIRSLVSHLPIDLLTLQDFPRIQEVAETGSTYEANAVLKARGYASQTGHWALADDSGFEVSVLAGAPGVISARYAGADASDRDRINFLLRQIELSASEDCRARFVSVVALADTTSSIANVTQGICDGTVIDTPRGDNGFGYDPIFVPEGFDQTFAELSADIKNVISHRAKALQAMRSFLERLVSES